MAFEILMFECFPIVNKICLMAFEILMFECFPIVNLWRLSTNRV